LHRINVSINFVKTKKMKNLDLNTYGVSEMASEEMKKIDGGIAPLAFIAIAAAIVAIIYLCGGEGETTIKAGN
jgi:lactobin A/cerein 7B family class IIb bacteriocin